MNFAKPVNAESMNKRSYKPTQKKSLLRRLLIALACLCIFVLLLLLSAPTLLSTQWAKERILPHLQNALGNDQFLQINSWSLSWWRPQTLTGILYQKRDPEQLLSAKIETLTLPALWHLLPFKSIRADLAFNQITLTRTPLHPLPHEKAATQTIPLPTTALQPTPPQQQTPATLQPLLVTPIDLTQWDLALNLQINNLTLYPMGTEGASLQLPHASLSLPQLADAATLSLDLNLIPPQSSSPLLSASLKATTTPLQPLLNANLHQQQTPLLQTLTLTTTGPIGELHLQANEVANSLYPHTLLKGTLTLDQLLPLLTPYLSNPEALTQLDGQLSCDLAFTPDTTSQKAHLKALLHAPLSLTYDGKTVNAPIELNTTADLHLIQPLASQINTLTLQLPGLALNAQGNLLQGNLDATLQTSPLFETFKPFLTETPLPQPTTLKASLASKDNTLHASLQVQSPTALISNTTLEIKGLQTLPTLTCESAHLKHATHLNPLASHLQLPFKNLNGLLSLNAKTLPGKGFSEISATAHYEDAKIQTNTWHIQAPELLSASLKTNLEKNRLTLRSATLKTPFSTLDASGVLDWNTSPATLSIASQGRIVPAIPLSQWRQWGKTTPFSLKGEIDYHLNLSSQETLQAQLDINTSTDFAYQQQDTLPIVCPTSLQAHLQRASNSLQLTHVKAATPYLLLQGKGTLSSQQHLDLTGDLTLHLDQLNQLPSLAQYHSKGFSISGNATRPFQLSTPLSMGVEGILNYGQGEASVAFDRLTLPGLDIPQGECTLTLRDALLTSHGKIQINQGYLHLNPQINLAARPATLTFPNDTLLLENFTLTQDLLNTTLKAINPLLPNSGIPQGHINLKVNHLYAPLSHASLPQLEGDLTLSTHAVAIAPNDLIASLLAYTKIRNKKLSLNDQSLNFKISEGKLTTSPLSLRIEDYSMTCQGNTNLLDRTLHYTLDIPLDHTPFDKLDPQETAAQNTLTLPITGSIDKPKIDLSDLISLLRQAATQKASQKATDAIERTRKKSKRADKIISGLLDAGLLDDPSPDIDNSTDEEQPHRAIQHALDNLFNRKNKKKK